MIVVDLEMSVLVVRTRLRLRRYNLLRERDARIFLAKWQNLMGSGKQILQR